MQLFKNKFIVYHCAFIVAFFLLFCQNSVYASGTIATEPIILADASGNSTAVWTYASNGKMRIESSTLLYNSNSWSNPITLSPPVNCSINQLLAKRDSIGNILVSWICFNPEYGIKCVYANCFEARIGSWSGPVLISEQNQTVQGNISISIDDGYMSVTWTLFDQESSQHLYCSTGTIGGIWSAPKRISLPFSEIDG